MQGNETSFRSILSLASRGRRASGLTHCRWREGENKERELTVMALFISNISAGTPPRKTIHTSIYTQYWKTSWIPCSGRASSADRTQNNDRRFRHQHQQQQRFGSNYKLDDNIMVIVREEKASSMNDGEAFGSAYTPGSCRDALSSFLHYATKWKHSR